MEWDSLANEGNALVSKNKQFQKQTKANAYLEDKINQHKFEGKYHHSRMYEHLPRDYHNEKRQVLKALKLEL